MTKYQQNLEACFLHIIDIYSMYQYAGLISVTNVY